MSCSDIPSVLDLQNTKKHVDDFGRLMGTGTGTSTNGVTGQVRPTYNKVIADLGFKQGTGDFTTGFTVQPGQRDYAWYDPVSKNWYSYLGVIPSTGYAVAPGTNPVGDINWKPVTDNLLRSDLASEIGDTLMGIGGGRTQADKNAEVVTLKGFGAKGDYITDDSDAIEAWLTHIGLTGRVGDAGDGVYRHTRSFDIPPGAIIRGAGSAKIAHFPLSGGDKSKLRPGYKHLINGAAFIFDGTATKTYTTNRSDRYASFSYVWGIPGYAGFDISGVSFLLDCDVYDEAGNLTTAATDNRSIAGSLIVNNGTLGNFSGVTVFGYTQHAAYVCHNQTGGPSFDADYISWDNNSMISGSVAIIGHDTAAGPSTEGLTGNRFVDSGIYGGDHHNRPDGDFTRGAIYIDGNMGPNPQDGIRAHMFTACNIRTYANDAIVTDHCNDISFVNCTYEFPALAGVAGADTTGGFVGTANTKRFRAFGAGATDQAKMFTYLQSITGPWQVIGAGELDTAVFGHSGKFVRLNADTNTAIIQFGDDLGTTVADWRIMWQQSSDILSIFHGPDERLSFNKDGGVQGGFGYHFAGTRNIVSDAISIGSASYYGVLGEGSVADNLATITGGLYDGHIVTFKTVLTASPITFKDQIGNLRLSGDRLLSSSQDRITLQWDGSNWCELSYADNS